MIEQFQALPLTGEGARAAYPLVYLHDASVSLADWLQYARKRGRGGAAEGGVMTIRDCRGIIHALFSYRVDVDLRARRRLCIGDMIVAYLPGRLIDEAIAASAREIAVHSACHSIFIEQPFAAALDAKPSCPTAQALAARPHPAATLHQN
ncbi:hypothetical protein [Bradyrhizobium sp. 2TAF24]|uniref:hypothetical protein n=1 Tax=Bradyrhizobium sp. 2TAF24 TaxID=3233011 RepID=UPI003F935015